MELTKYLSMGQKKKIEVMYEAYVEGSIKVRIPYLSLSVDEPATVVRKYILDRFGEDAKKNLYARECEYLSTTGDYLRFTDYYQLYLHQYILSRELKLEADTIKKYIVHHKNEDKKNNELNNLYLFFNNSMHRSWHMMEEKFKNIKEFTYYYINKEIKYIASAEQTKELSKYERELREYIMLVEQLEQKKKTLDIGVPKAI